MIRLYQFLNYLYQFVLGQEDKERLIKILVYELQRLDLIRRTNIKGINRYYFKVIDKNYSLRYSRSYTFDQILVTSYFLLLFVIDKQDSIFTEVLRGSTYKSSMYEVRIRIKYLKGTNIEEVSIFKNYLLKISEKNDLFIEIFKNYKQYRDVFNKSQEIKNLDKNTNLSYLFIEEIIISFKN